jgi:hypothetical protein
MNTEELDHLIHDCLEGCLGESEAARLSALLEQSAEARERYWATASVHGLLEHSLQQASLRVITGQETRAQIPVVRWFHWRPFAAAAAGLAFGICGASMVWAYALPMAERTAERTISTLTEGFENPELTPPRGFPRQANEWSGDLSAPVRAESGVAPIEGDRMARLEQAAPNLRRFSYAWRIVDLAELPAASQAETLKVEVSAAFNAPGEARALHYQIRLAAFSQEPGEVRRIWNNESVLFDTVLQHVGRNVHVEADDPDWQVVQASMEIPPGTRSLLISLAASEADSASAPTEYYLDDVQARFVIAEPPGE